MPIRPDMAVLGNPIGWGSKGALIYSGPQRIGTSASQVSGFQGSRRQTPIVGEALRGQVGNRPSAHSCRLEDIGSERRRVGSTFGWHPDCTLPTIMSLLFYLSVSFRRFLTL